MSALGSLLLGLLLICAMFVVVFVVVLVFGKTEQRFVGKHWGNLVVGVLATALGVRTLITGYIGHWLYSPQMSASGARARAAGALFLVMGITIIWSWLRNRRKPENPDGKVSDDGT